MEEVCSAELAKLVRLRTTPALSVLIAMDAYDD